MKKLFALSLLATAGVANAATDLTDITAAETDSLAVAAALLSMSIAVWAATYVRRKFFR